MARVLWLRVKMPSAAVNLASSPVFAQLLNSPKNADLPRR
jgi:hypothetical protein